MIALLVMGALAEPAARVPYVDATGVTVERITDRDADQTPAGEAKGLVAEYARVVPSNADGTRMLVMSTEGTWYLYDTATHLPITKLAIGGDVEPRWFPDDPDRLWYVQDTALHSLDVATGDEATVRDFAKDFRKWHPVLVLSKGEGSPSDDGRYAAFLVEQDGDYAVRGFFVYDLAKDKIVARYDLAGKNQALDNVSMSHTGRFVIAAFEGGGECAEGTLGTAKAPCGLMVFDRRLRKAHGVARTVGELDAALDADGRDVVFFQDNEHDAIAVGDCATGKVTDLVDIDFAAAPEIGIHFSGRASKRPGWGLVFWVELATGKVVPIAHSHSRKCLEGCDDYFAETHATSNQDGTRVWWSSNWGRRGSIETDVYEARQDPP